jgi:hypothetical protein
MPSRLHAVLGPVLLGAALPLFAAGTVEVSFVDPQGFSDAGSTALETERNTRVLAEELHQLARRLPDGQQLRVEVLDIDLAGSVRHGSPVDLRVMRGGADWPSLRLRYTLSADGRPLRTGEESIADLDYLRAPPVNAPGTRLPYEQRLLARWFNERIAGVQAQ